MRTLRKFAVIIIFSFFQYTLIDAHIEDRLERLECELQNIIAYNSQNTLGLQFVTARPEVEGTPWFLTFDVLYWHAKLGATEYAYSCQPNFEFSGTQISLFPISLEGRTKSNNFDWDFGLKIGLGYKSNHDQWSLYAQYTYFSTLNSTSTTKLPPAVLIPLTTFDLVFAKKIKSRIELSYQNVEFELGRSYFESKYLSFHPHIDLKSTWLDLCQDIFITASPIANTNETTGLDYKTKGISNFWGIGPRAGIDSQWYLSQSFYLFNDIAGSLLFGYFKTLQYAFFPPSAMPELSRGEIFRAGQKFHRFIPFVQLYLGLGWETYTPQEGWHIGLKLGYEVLYYWRVNQIAQSKSIVSQLDNISFPSQRLQFEKSSEDLMFYGIRGEVRLDF